MIRSFYSIDFSQSKASWLSTCSLRLSQPPMGPRRTPSQWPSSHQPSIGLFDQCKGTLVQLPPFARMVALSFCPHHITAGFIPRFSWAAASVSQGVASLGLAVGLVVFSAPNIVVLQFSQSLQVGCTHNFMRVGLMSTVHLANSKLRNFHSFELPEKINFIEYTSWY